MYLVAKHEDDMIYGLNFNGSHIPEQIKRRFAAKVRVDGHRYDLQGVAENENDLNWMLGQASNGRRKLHTEVRGKLTGVYVG